jgi:hypothetical protein
MQYFQDDAEKKEFNDLERLVLTTDLATDAIDRCVAVLRSGKSYVSRPLRTICSKAIVAKTRLGLLQSAASSEWTHKLDQPISDDERFVKVSLRRTLANELDALKYYLLNIRANIPDNLKPRLAFLAPSGNLADEFVKLLESFNVSMWTLLPSQNREYFKLEVSGICSEAEFNQLKSLWLEDNGLTDDDIPLIVYTKTNKFLQPEAEPET